MKKLIYYISVVTMLLMLGEYTLLANDIEMNLTKNYSNDIGIKLCWGEDDESNQETFKKSHTFAKSDGEIVNFWIYNKGDYDIKITINGENERIIKSGKAGHISQDLTKKSNFLVFEATCEFGNVDIDYSIQQRG